MTFLAIATVAYLVVGAILASMLTISKTSQQNIAQYLPVNLPVMTLIFVIILLAWPLAVNASVSVKKEAK